MGSYKTDDLFVNNTTVVNSAWAPVGELESVVIVVSGMVATDILQIWGTNDDLLKAALINEEQLGADITADGIYQVSTDGIPAFIRAKRTAIAGGGTVDVRYGGRR